jgi:hypothetical protein
MTTGAVILWFQALKVVKENTLPGQVTTYSCVRSSDQDPNAPESYGNDDTSKVYQVPVPLPVQPEEEKAG